MLQEFAFVGVRQIDAAGTFIRYEAETAGAANPAVKLRANGQDLGEYLPGDSIELAETFTRLEVAPVAGAEGRIRVGRGRVTSSRVTLGGSVNSTMQFSPRSAFANAAATVVSASSSVLAAANPTRRYLLVQNNHATGAIFLRFGVAATLGTGIRIGPGGFWEWNANVPDNALNAIGEVPSNTAIVVVEG